jgi:hypothetical protein
LVDELFRLFRHGNSLEEKKQKKMVKYRGRKRVEVSGEKKFSRNLSEKDYETFSRKKLDIKVLKDNFKLE